MSLVGSPCSAGSSYLSAYDSNALRQKEKSNELDINLKNEGSSRNQATEYVFRGELLEEAAKNNGFRPQKDQNIDPENREAISRYEDNNTPIESTNVLRGQGRILDAYA